MMHTVYVFEPQRVFIPTLVQIVTAAGARAVTVTGTLDVEELASLDVDFALLDLDYTEYGVADGLALLHRVARDVKPIVLTDERDLSRIAWYRDGGAASIVSKDQAPRQVQDSLRRIFEAGNRLASLRRETAKSTGPREAAMSDRRPVVVAAGVSVRDLT
jgi:DNA-binding NarL/FixJ family response regulator